MQTEYGTKPIGQEPLERQGCFWISAKDLTRRNVVLVTLPNNSTKRILPGRSKPSRNMHTIGCKRTKGGAMDPMHARGSLMQLLSEEQVSRLHHLENQQPPGRYWMCFEIMTYFRIQNQTVTPEQEAEITNCYLDWQKSHDNDNKDDDTTIQQKIHLWDAFARKNYREPLPSIQSGGWNS